MIIDIQWSFISLVTASFFHFLLRVVIGRELGVSGLGIYTLVFTIYMIEMQSASFGIGEALTKYIAQYEGNTNKMNKYVSSGLLGTIVSGSVMGFLLYLLSETIALDIFHNFQMIYLLKILSICFPFIGIQKTVIGTLNGLRKMDYYAIINIIQNMSIFIMSVIMVIFYNMDLNGAIYGLVIPSIIIGIISLAFIKQYFVLTNMFHFDILKELLWFGSYVVLVNSLGIVNAQISNLLVGYYINEIEVGYYATAIILIQAIILIPNAIQRVTFPTIATYYEKKEYQSITMLIKNIMFKTFVITIIFSVLLVLFGKIIISMLFTKDFLPAYVPLIILLIGNSIYAPVVSVGGALSGIGKLNLVFRISIISVFLNTVCNMLLIPVFGIIGAATATSLSLIFATIVELYFIDIHLKTNFLKISHWKTNLEPIRKVE